MLIAFDKIGHSDRFLLVQLGDEQRASGLRGTVLSAATTPAGRVRLGISTDGFTKILKLVDVENAVDDRQPAKSGATGSGLDVVPYTSPS